MPPCKVNLQPIEEYLLSLTKKEREKIAFVIAQLEQYGRTLPARGQWAKVVKNSRHQPELLELRATIGRSVLRIAYYIDTTDTAHLLWGGDKRSTKKEKLFYDRLIRTADRAIDLLKQQSET